MARMAKVVMGMMRGSGAAGAQLSTHYVFDFAYGRTCIAGLRLNQDGNLELLENATYTAQAGEWMTAGVNSDYEARATTISGTPTTGTVGSWLGLGTSREWTVSVNIPTHNKTYKFTLEIRRVSDGVVIASAIMQIEAERDVDPGL